jgi:hypothetical protein
LSTATGKEGNKVSVLERYGHRREADSGHVAKAVFGDANSGTGEKESQFELELESRATDILSQDNHPERKIIVAIDLDVRQAVSIMMVLD